MSVLTTEIRSSAAASLAGSFPCFRHTKTVSMIEDAVPLMWIDPPISAGHGIAQAIKLPGEPYRLIGRLVDIYRSMCKRHSLVPMLMLVFSSFWTSSRDAMRKVLRR